MAGRFWHHDGGIRGILQELDAHEDAIRYDLLSIGFTIEDIPHRLGWRTVKAFLSASPKSSAYVRSKLGHDAAWTLEADLMAGLIDTVRDLHWALGGGKGQRPKPIERPSTRGSQKKYGAGESWTPESIDEWLRQKEAA